MIAADLIELGRRKYLDDWFSSESDIQNAPNQQYQQILASATGVELPDAESKTYSTINAGSSPCDNFYNLPIINKTMADGEVYTIWKIPNPTTLTVTTTHPTAIVGMTVALSGFDLAGIAQTETVTVPANGTTRLVETANSYAYLASVQITSADNATTNTLSLGFNDVKGRLWSDTVLLSGLNYAQRKAADWGFLIRDETSALTSFTLVGNDPVYSIDRRITCVNTMAVADPEGTVTAIPAITKERAEQLLGPRWRMATGKPVAYIPKGYEIQLVPMPDMAWAGQTIYMDIYRLPLADMGLLDSPEIPDAMHEDLLLGMAWQACLLRNSEVDNTVRAKMYKDQFLEVFGPETSTANRMNRLHNPESFIMRPQIEPDLEWGRGGRSVRSW